VRLAVSACAALIVEAGCDQNMSDRPLPKASAEDVSQVAARLSQAPSLSVPAGSTIAGLIDLAPRLAGLTAPSDVVFVIARDPESEAPPLAVLRLTGNTYPMRFVLDASTAMLPGSAIARPVQLIAKVDKDGDAGTSGADDLLGFTPEPVEPGDSSVRMTVEGTLGELARAMQEQGGTTGGSGTPGAESAPNAGASGSAGSGDGATAPGPGARESRPGAAAPPASGAARLAGSITLPPSLASRTSPSDVVFVVARAPGASGPPLAVARLNGNRYPMDFRLDDSNRMLGGAWPPAVEIEVRVDEDGDATTRGPHDLTGRTAAPVAIGETDVRIELGD
jgi:hypothetical protein